MQSSGHRMQSDPAMHCHRGARPRQDLSGAREDPRQGARRPDAQRRPGAPSSPSSARTAPARPPPSRSSPPSPRPDEGTAAVEGIDVIAAPGAGPPGHRRRRAALGRRPGGHRPGEPDPAGRTCTACPPGRPRGSGPTSCSTASSSPRRPAASSAPTPAACSAASTSPSASCTSPGCCSSTSRPPGSTRSRAPRCGTRSPRWPRPTR